MLPKILQNLLWPLARFIFWFFFGYRVVGQKNCKNLQRPFVIISNHVSWLDPFLITAAFPWFSKFFPFRYAAKRELFEKKIPKFLIPALGGFEVRRGVGPEKTLTHPLEILKNVGVIVIFPSGVREKPRGRPRKARRGAAYLALKTGAPLLPMAVRNAKGLKFKFGDFIKRKLKQRKITIIIGKPFYLPKEFKCPEHLDKATEIIDKTLHRLRGARVVKIKDWLDYLVEGQVNGLNGKLFNNHKE